MAIPDPQPRAAVIIPHYNDVARLTRCLAALMVPDGASARDGVDIVVVDNGSTEPLGPVRAAHPGIRFVTEPGKGAALARNRGVAETTAPRLYFLDADCVPAPDWLATAHRVAEQADIVGGRVDVFDETPAPRSGAEAFEAVFAFRCRDYVEAEGFSVTANMLTRRDVFNATGEFRNGLPEDRDWCLRARDLGYSIAYADDLAVAHPSRSDWDALRRKWLRLTREAFARDAVGVAGRVRWGLRAGAVAASAGAHLPRLWRAPELTDPGERRRGVATLLRLRLVRAGWMLRQAVGLPV
ncbi:glycosyltransferase family 2 protein [Actibacterium sp. D379-3]